MTTTGNKLDAIAAEVARLGLSARGIAQQTGLHKNTVSKVLKKETTVRPATVNFLYTWLILKRDRGDTGTKEMRNES